MAGSPTPSAGPIAADTTVVPHGSEPTVTRATVPAAPAAVAAHENQIEEGLH
jgi:hypothetical protein